MDISTLLCKRKGYCKNSMHKRCYPYVFFNQINIISLCLSFFFPSLSYAIPSSLSLTLTEAIKIALDNSYELKTADQSILDSKFELNKAKASLYPKIDLSFNDSYIETIEKFEPVKILFNVGGTDFTVLPLKNVPKYQSILSVEIKQRLFTGGETIHKIEGTKKKVDFNEIAKQEEKRNIIFSVIRAYWELKRSEKIVEVENNKIRQVEIMSDVANSKYDKGAISGVGKEKSETYLINTRIDSIQTNLQKKLANDSLIKEMGLIEQKEILITPVDEPVPLYDFLSTPYEIDKMEEEALSRRPELLQLKSKIDFKGSNVKVAKSEYYPQIDLKGEYNWIGFSDDTFVNSFEGLNRNYWSVMLVARMTLFDGFLIHNNISQARNQVSIATNEYERQKQSILLEVRNAINKIIGIQQKMELARRNIIITENALKAVTKEFELGVTTIDKVSESITDLAYAQKAYINFLIDYEIVKAELKWVLGEKLPLE